MRTLPPRNERWRCCLPSTCWGESARIVPPTGTVSFRKAGITVRKTVDVIIGSFCIDEGLPLLFSDRDFRCRWWSCWVWSERCPSTDGGEPFRRWHTGSETLLDVPSQQWPQHVQIPPDPASGQVFAEVSPSQVELGSAPRGGPLTMTRQLRGRCSGATSTSMARACPGVRFRRPRISPRLQGQPREQHAGERSAAVTATLRPEPSPPVGRSIPRPLERSLWRFRGS